MTFNILVVDPRSARGDSLARLLRCQGLCTKAVSSAQKLLDQISRHSRPVSGSGRHEGLILIPDDGDHISNTLKKIRNQGHDLPAAAYTTSSLNSRKVFEAYCLGVFDYFSLPSDELTMPSRIREAISKSMLTYKNADKAALASEKVRLLSPRELEVMELLVVGESSKEAARALRISFRTVEIHRQSVMTKFSAKNTYEAVAIYVLSKIPNEAFAHRNVN